MRAPPRPGPSAQDGPRPSMCSLELPSLQLGVHSQSQPALTLLAQRRGLTRVQVAIQCLVHQRVLTAHLLCAAWPRPDPHPMGLACSPAGAHLGVAVVATYPLTSEGPVICPAGTLCPLLSIPYHLTMGPSPRCQKPQESQRPGPASAELMRLVTGSADSLWPASHTLGVPPARPCHDCPAGEEGPVPGPLTLGKQVNSPGVRSLATWATHIPLGV